jgi:glucokinase
MEHVLGVDVGGNHVKMAFVDPEGGTHQFQSYATKDFIATGDFTKRLAQTIQFRLLDYNQPVTRVGIGFPGTLSKDRRRTLEVPAISELNNQPTGLLLQEAMPNIKFFLANDAKAAAMGELLFGTNTLPDSFAFVTLGTGVGSAFVLDRQLFLGADGNALELGHILSRNEQRLEQNIGKQGILSLAETRLAQFNGETTISRLKPISATEMVLCAGSGDSFCRETFFEIGQILGESLVALIRILDVKTILIGGGLSASFDYVRPGIEKVLYRYLTPYYLEGLTLSRATLGNDAGLLGAASLCF